jgi:hypothetical protein
VETEVIPALFYETDSTEFWFMLRGRKITERKIYIDVKRETQMNRQIKSIN